MTSDLTDSLLLPGALVVPGNVGHHTLQVQLGGLNPPIVEAVAAVAVEERGRLEHTNLLTGQTSDQCMFY